jgi:TonB family protein
MSLRAAPAVLCTLLWLSTGALAQTTTPPPGAIAGVVLDAPGQKPLADATVSARSPALPGEQTAVTDADGAFEMTLLPPGTYSLKISHDGFETFSPELVVRDRRIRVRLYLVPEKSAPSVAQLTETAVEFNDSMTAPEMVSGPNPEYSPEALDREVEGNMLIRCVVTTSGSVRSCRVLKSLPFMDTAVVTALERRKYKPATFQGRPLEVFYTFNLKLAMPK